MQSEVVEVLLEVLKTHLVFVHLSVLIAIFDLIESNLATNGIEHHHDIFRHQVPLSASHNSYFYRSRW